NFPLAWMVGNVEQYADALTAGFDTYPSATLDVMFGRFTPTGKLPITLPKNDAVLAVNKNGVCVSPNDVPGYDKDQYMPDELKDENGKAYAYRDAVGNYYELNFGLTY
ncbi:MAG: glycoside hydrolase family 3 protein, partial [Clostridiales bacterium]|nr:glycoside hydrolase family 3 protein [Clostridiales bacterium]